MLESFAQAFDDVFLTFATLQVILFAAAYGIFIGAIPGLTATMAVALLVPITYYMEPLPALAAIVTLEACAIFAGDIPNTLLRIPGTPSSAAYTEDAYAFTRAGRHQQALGISLVFSVVGGLFGAVILMIAAPSLAQFALQFTSFENFWLVVLGLSCAAMVAHGSKLKSAIALLLGLLLSTVGLGDVHAQPRFMFGIDALIVGIHFIPAMIGLFGISEVLRNLLRGLDIPSAPGTSSLPDDSSGAAESGMEAANVQTPPSTASAPGLDEETLALLGVERQRVFVPALPLLIRRKFHTVRSMIIGTFVGILPGAGADIGAWVSIAASKKLSKHPERYGRGSVEGLSDATAANNAALGGAWVPTLVLGIPGDSVTAIVIGVLLMKNVKPGPSIFQDQPELLFSIYLTFIAANLVLLPLGFLAIRGAGQLIRIPRKILLPAILLFSTVGAFALNNDVFDIWIMLAMGVFGFALESFRVPLGPLVLGLILGSDVERYFIQSMNKTEGNIFSLLNPGRPIAAFLGLACMVMWVLPVIMRVIRLVRRPKQTGTVP